MLGLFWLQFNYRLAFWKKWANEIVIEIVIVLKRKNRNKKKKKKKYFNLKNIFDCCKIKEYIVNPTRDFISFHGVNRQVCSILIKNVGK